MVDEVKWMWRTRIKDQRGQALVEMALVLPLLLLLVLGIIQFGFIFMSQLAVNNATREGARYAAVHEITQTSLETIVSEYSFVLDHETVKDGTEYQYYKSDATATADRTRGGWIEITVSYPVQIFAPIISGIIGNPKWVSATVTMRVE